MAVKIIDDFVTTVMTCDEYVMLMSFAWHLQHLQD